MTSYYGNKLDVAEFVEDLLTILKLDWQSITVIPHPKFVGYCVSIATDTSSESIAKGLALNYSLKPYNI